MTELRTGVISSGATILRLRPAQMTQTLSRLIKISVPYWRLSRANILKVESMPATAEGAGSVMTSLDLQSRGKTRTEGWDRTAHTTHRCWFHRTNSIT